MLNRMRSTSTHPTSPSQSGNMIFILSIYLCYASFCVHQEQDFRGSERGHTEREGGVRGKRSVKGAPRAPQRRALAHTHTHTHTQTHTHTHTHTHTLTYIPTHIHTCIHAYMHTRTHARTHARTSTRARTHTHKHTHTRRGGGDKPAGDSFGLIS